MTRFKDCNPVVILLFYICVIVITMFTTNPIFQGVSLMGSVVLYIQNFSKKEILKDFKFNIILIILITFTNPLISHKGTTILFMIGNLKITLESLVYGAYISVLIVSVRLWFKTYNRIMTSDKSMYIFSKIIPNTSVALSTSLRFVPMIKNHIEEVKKSQISMGKYKDKTIKNKIRSSCLIFYSTISWMFESSFDTASSMESRGFNTGKRTSFSVFKFRFSDFLLVILNVTLVVIIMYMMIKGGNVFSYYPQISYDTSNSMVWISYISFTVLVLLPSVLNLLEYVQWRYHLSKIR